MAAPAIIHTVPAMPVDTGFQRVYGATAAARLAGISYRQIDHWERMGVLKPSVHEAHKAGDRRQYSEDDVLVLAVLGELTRLGARIQNLAAAESAIRKALHKEPRWLIVTPESLVDTCTGDMLTLCLEMQGAAGAWVVDIKLVMDRLDLDQ